MAKVGLSSRVVATRLQSKGHTSMSHTTVCKIMHSGRKPLKWSSIKGGRKGGYSLIMDHARQHSYKATQIALQNLGVNVVKGYPPQSWDLNIIENVWGTLQGRITKANANTGSGWRKKIEKAWDGIGLMGSINLLHEGYPDRLILVGSKGGEWCSHH